MQKDKCTETTCLYSHLKEGRLAPAPCDAVTCEPATAPGSNWLDWKHGAGVLWCHHLRAEPLRKVK